MTQSRTIDTEQASATLQTARRSPFSALKMLRLLWPYVRPYRARLTGALVSLVIAAGLVLGLGRGLNAVIDYGFAQNNVSWLNLSLLVMMGVTACLAIATYMRFYLVAWLSERVVADLRTRIFERLLHLDVSYFETARPGELTSRLTSDTTLLQTVIGSSLSMALRNLLLLIGGMVLLTLTSPKLMLLVLIGIPIVVTPIVIYIRRTRHLARQSQDRVADLGAEVAEIVGAIPTVHAFTGEAMAAAQFTSRAEDAFISARRRIQSRAILTATVIFLVFSAIGVILWLGGHDVLAGRLTAGQLSAFIFYAVLVAGAAAAISEVMADLERAAGATARIYDLLNETAQIADPVDPISLPIPAQGAIVFDHVSFAYRSAPDRPVLHDVSFAINPGERVAIVGPSGAGKSTLFHLLLRFYDPQSGSVTLDGVDLRRAKLEALRRRIGIVPQEPVLFSASARDNISFGQIEASDAAITAAAETANAAGFIAALPRGMDTHLGERGVRLSGGQRQRLAVARAVLRIPSILLLDEATSALDAESERLVQEALERVMPGRTTLIIAHRLATVLSADRILVMEGGRLVESGTHAELVAAGGLYARLAALQFQDPALPAA